MEIDDDSDASFSSDDSVVVVSTEPRSQPIEILSPEINISPPPSPTISAERRRGRPRRGNTVR